MEADPKVLVMGEDVGRLGGVFRVTEGLQKDFGEDRVIDTPLAESGIVGTAVGLALRGYRPVVEIQFDGFVYPAFDQIIEPGRQDARPLAAGASKLPMVIRIPCGGGIGAVEHHSESNEAYFAHSAGLRVVACSNAEDAYWMIQQAIATDDPVIFFEPKRRYHDRMEVDEGAAAAPRALYDAVVARPGTDVTVACYGPMVKTCLAGGGRGRRGGHGTRGHRPALAQPARLRRQLGASVAQDRAARRRARGVAVPGVRGGDRRPGAAESCFYHLEAPVLRVGGYDSRTRRASSRRSSCPTSTACSTPSTARSRTDRRRHLRHVATA